jgi:hypothetical protein
MMSEPREEDDIALGKEHDEDEEDDGDPDGWHDAQFED